jgi:dihydroxyacetone kinase DhaKLM complex PTS-EIIA-like component DhaM
VDAPFVEGAVAAAVLAGTGADLAAVATAAVEARDARKL